MSTLRQKNLPVNQFFVVTDRYGKMPVVRRCKLNDTTKLTFVKNVLELVWVAAGENVSMVQWFVLS